MTREEYERAMAHWTATRTDGRPIVPHNMQVEVCNYWREEARLDSIRRERELKAKFYAPAATSLLGYPWQDTQ